MLASLLAECAKLRRSLVLLLCASAPLMVALIALLSLTRGGRAGSWAMFSVSASAVWAFFMLPMTVTALTVLAAQLEHGAKSWNHLLALPLPRWRHYAAKAVVVVLLAAAMTVGLWLALPLAGSAAEAIAPGTQLTGAYGWGDSAALLSRMFASALLLIALQLWTALRFRSFVPPLVLGIAGTFVGVAATGSEDGIWFPWLIPTNALASDPARADLALAIGGLGGLAVFALMLWDLSRREFG
jgi:lantibiotic transport system permease protein